MGEVWLAEDAWLGRTVALKLIHAHLAARPAVTQAFLREARVHAGLSFPGVVPVYDIGTWVDGRPFYTMEVVDGVSLAHTGDRLAALAHAVKAAQILGRVHAAGVVHRDIKPDNVLVGSKGDVWLVDWGLAVLIDGEDGFKGAGTPGYMPPEQASGAAARPSADVYALAALVAELMVGRPLEGDAAEWFAGQAQDGLPAGLAPLIRRGLAAEPEARFETASPFADALDACLEAARARSAERALEHRLEGQVQALAPALRLPLRHCLGGLVLDGQAVEVPVEQLWVPHQTLQDLLDAIGPEVLTRAGGTLALGRPTLMEEWPRLGALLEADKEDREAVQHLRRAVLAWTTEGRPDAGLWRGKPLERILELASQPGLTLPEAQGEFLDASTRAEARALKEIARRRSVMSAVGLVVVLLLAAQLVLTTRARNEAVLAQQEGAIRLLQVQAASAEAQGVPHRAGALLAEVVARAGPEHAELARASERELRRLLADRVQLAVIPVAESRLLSVAWSPNGEVAVAGEEGVLRLFDPDSGRETARLDADQGNTWYLDWSRDGGLLAASGRGSPTRIGPPSELRDLETDLPVISATLSPDGRLYAVGMLSGGARVFDSATGAVLWNVEERSLVRAITFSADGERIYLGTRDGWVRSYAIGGAAPLHAIEVGEIVDELALSPDGEHLAILADRLSSRVVSADLGELDGPDPLPGRRDLLHAVWADNHTLLVARRDGGVFHADLRDGALARLGWHEAGVQGVEISPDGRWIATTGMGGDVAIWSVEASLQNVGQLQVSDSTLTEPRWSPDSKTFAVGTARGELMLVTMPAVDAVQTVSCDGQVATIADSVWGRGDFVVQTPGGSICTPEGSLHRVPAGADLLDIDRLTGALLYALDGAKVVQWEGERRSLPAGWLDGRPWTLLASGGLARIREDVLRVEGFHGELLAEWDLTGGSRLFPLTGQDASLGLAPAQGIRVAGAEGVGPALWDHDGVSEFDNGQIAVSPDGTRLAVLGGDRRLRVVEARSPEVVLVDVEASDLSHTLKWSGDGRRLAGAGSEGQLNVWDAQTGELLLRRVHPAAVSVEVLSLSPRGELAALTYLDGGVEVVDVSNGEVRALLTPRGSLPYFVGWRGEEELWLGESVTYRPFSWTGLEAIDDAVATQRASSNLRACPDGRVVAVVPFPVEGSATPCGQFR